MEIVTEQVTVTTTGSAGAATGSATTGTLHGFLLDIYFDFSGSAPGTTDTTVAYTPVGGNILVITNSATDALIAPRDSLVTAANVAITDSHDRYPLNGKLTISLAQCDALATALTAYIRYLRI